MALEQVLDIAGSDAFDLIVVDTPPASHALDLFEAPERILALLNSRALDYLEEPTRILTGVTSRLAKGLLSAVLSGLERMTGLSLLRDISSLAGDFHLVSPGFRERAEAIHALLRAPSTRYVLVATPEPHGAEDTLRFAREIGRLGVALRGVIINRVLGIEAIAADAPAEAAPLREAAPPKGDAPATAGGWTAPLARRLVACADDLALLEEGQREVIESLRTGLRALQGAGDADAPEPHWLELPAFFPAPVSLAGVSALARALRQEPRSATTAA
jgi:anion-transporting  ArsA/GET3 family ATPase